jgi:hypothetical protein
MMSTNLEQRVMELETRFQDLSDREAIRNVIHRYCRSADRCDLEGFKACYWPDGTDDHGFFGGNAWEFCEYVIPVLKQISASVHAITNTIIDLNGNRAHCESQWSVVHRLMNATGYADFWHQGRYIDIFEKRNGEWRILHRAIASDCDRWFKTIDFRGRENESSELGDRDLLGTRYPNDMIFDGPDFVKRMKSRPGEPDLWGPFHALAEMPLP